MNYQSQTFSNERIDLAGKSFHNCTFQNCELVFDGDRSPTFKDNKFVDTVFVFTNEAVRTLYFLANIYHAGEGGQQVIEDTFGAIRQGSFHGREARTCAPATVNHSLA
jgi:hypothetical protein